MRASFLVTLAVAVGCGLALGCQEDSSRPPPVPISTLDGGGGSPFFPGGGRPARRDAGTADASVGDGGDLLSSGFDFNECLDDADLSMVRNAVFMPTDFPITMGFAHWVGSCGDPALEIGLSTGRCPVGDGHILAFQIDADAILDGTLFIPGANQVIQERPDRPIVVRYARPTTLVPSGVWGTCDEVFGEFTIESLGLLRGAPQRAEFSMTLASCTSSTTATSISVTGSFDIDLARGLDDVCPDAVVR